MSTLASSMWNSNRKYYEANLSALTNENYLNRLSHNTSSGAFLVLHVAESMLYTSMLLGNPVPMPEIVTIAAMDNGQVDNLETVKDTFSRGLDAVTEAISNIAEEDMNTVIDTYIGPVSKGDLIAYLIHHTGYHLGQASLAIKRGQVYALQAA